MSQHLFNTVYQDRPLQVMLGYDRPLGHVFMTLTYLDDGSSLYSNLDQPNAFDLSLDDYAAQLHHLGIGVPQSIFEETFLDAMFNEGNRFMTHLPDGTYVPTVQEPQT